MDVKLQFSSDLERIYVLHVQPSNCLCDLITALWQRMPKYTSDLPQEPPKLGKNFCLKEIGFPLGALWSIGQRCVNPWLL